ncbi:family 78 glycoside hydrolase catalytic domain [Curtobacterium sp. BRB10]|uniref:alpha-L-rhamnosidase n=1 Tax=Curtobacterium sp. BRB10 TaxID=2962579 RepID=UPI002881C1CE|nr:family 78 glycoside hydrolase catalytic domain [Curtobacterium sp. BRB10]MDT0234846.1 family 78 glycoside hydrolase catalytic domain [Curtobacterium sp. BRB10]
MTGDTVWTAPMITADTAGAPVLVRTVAAETGHGAVVSARLRATALGIVDAWVNGVRASADLLTPGWTTYERRLRAVEWDVTDAVGDTTTVALHVGNGWYRGRLGWNGLRAAYGDERAASAELVLEYADGHTQRVATDETWSAADSGTTADDLYDGQTIDATGAHPRDAHHPGFPSTLPVRTVEFDAGTIVASSAPPIRAQEELVPTLVEVLDDGDLLLDFGQNIAGWLRVTVRGPRGHEVVVRHAEVLEDGDLAVRPLRSAEATDRYTLSGDEDTFEPTFTFHGFRYARVSGWPEAAETVTDRVRAVVIGSALRRTGTFACSDERVNQLHRNVVWGMRGNFVGLPTDCPQRDERMAYVGDLAAFAPTAAYLFDVREFLTDWLVDLSLEQEMADGQVPLIAPNSQKFEESVVEAPEGGWGDFRPGPMALWQDGAVWIPWTVYEQYGDAGVLAQQRDSIDRYVRYVEDSLDEAGTMTAGFQLGDWLDPAAPPEDPRAARADREVVATACMYRTMSTAARIAAVLGDDDLAAHRTAVAARIRDGFRAAYVEADGRIRSDAPTVYALAIVFGLVDGDQAAAAGQRLAELIAEAGFVISTGFVGTPFVLHALSETGHGETAYRLLTQEACPSWLYQVGMGATTIWERWDALLPDGTVNPGEMTSFNHYALGSVADWLHRVVAGIRPAAPGSERILFAPLPGGGITSASAHLDTPHGTAGIDWRVDDGTLRVELLVPVGTEAVLRLPDGTEQTLRDGRHEVVAETAGTVVGA